MPRADASRRRCALYTRKSSEEGLEQEFNSLAAQREACEAYIRSQQHEGWVLARNRYDDGGFSGGNLDRPALQCLLADIRAGRIDIVVVYKVDRLTRSLADFARLVEIFDAQGVSFVSVTQQFNTTSSMGRLTLNVLLSFAQFEREVTGERIRDKIAASKKKGMWMGGNVPLGYDANERTLVINPAEAETVRRIFALYRELGCVRRVKEGRRYRYYVSAALIAEAGTDREGWRLAAREIEEAVIRILADALTSPASLVERFGAAGMASDQVRKLLSRAARMAAALGGSPGERAKLVHEFVEKIIVDEKTINIKLRRSFLLGIPSSASEAASEGAVELTAAVAFTRRGAETKLVLPGLAPQKHSSKCDPALIKAIARGRVWFEELVSGRARSLQELAKRDGISRRYIRRLIGLAFLSPELIEAILQGRQPVALSATRLTELDLPLDWTEQHKLLAS